MKTSHLAPGVGPSHPGDRKEMICYITDITQIYSTPQISILNIDTHYSIYAHTITILQISPNVGTLGV